MKRVSWWSLTLVPALLLVGCTQPSDDRGDDAKAGSARTSAASAGLSAPDKKDLAQRLVSSAENSSLDWRAQFGYVEDIGDGRGYTAGIIGFTTGTHDLLALVERYTQDHPDNGLARFLPALRAVDGTPSHEGLGGAFTAAWKAEAKEPAFQDAQIAARDRGYFDPAVALAKRDGLGTLGQFVYYDAIVVHGPGEQPEAFHGIRRAAMRKAATKAEGGDETAYLNAFLDERRKVMRGEKAHRDTSRIDTAQRAFLKAGNLSLDTPLTWSMYGDEYRIP
ncbi:chitosanase [Streptomyces sp. NPDC060194]|uniref:chitosanase n=1 Tax=Streptomyces sp. NPDC060194 TaxID=3347069 RepID=UPI003664B1D4